MNATVSSPTVVAGGQCTCVQGAAEACNGCDDNCNGMVDEGCGNNGVMTNTNVVVSGPSYQPPPTTGSVVVTGTVPTTTTTTTVAQPPPVQCVCRQGAAEICGDRCDNNCNGSIDEGC
jgi:hypothetical protein